MVVDSKRMTGQFDGLPFYERLFVLADHTINNKKPYTLRIKEL